MKSNFCHTGTSDIYVLDVIPFILEEHLEDTIVDPDKYVLERELSDTFDEILETLTPRESYVLKHYYGIGSDSREGETFKDIANYLRVSSCRVHQIRNKALIKLRHPSCKGKLIDFVDLV